MNDALLSSKKLDWCTPADFFKELDQEFHFNLDPAATAKSAKCAKYFTPADDGLKADWGGAACSAILHTDGRSASGCARATRKAKSPAPSLLCSYRPERTRHIFTTMYSTEKPTRCASCAGDSHSQTRTATRPQTPKGGPALLPSPLPSLSGEAQTRARASGTWCWI
nr:MAG TPA: DNA N-6-adenine-methyltransferase [Caudoviricetes sp.]